MYMLRYTMPGRPPAERDFPLAADLYRYLSENPGIVQKAGHTIEVFFRLDSAKVLKGIA